MPTDGCCRCKTSLKLQDELEQAPVSTKKGEVCSRCYREMTKEELDGYIK